MKGMKGYCALPMTSVRLFIYVLRLGMSMDGQGAGPPV